MKTKDIIIQKGMNILLETGYYAASIQNIVKAAGIPKGSFYYYFESKDMFCLEIINHCADEINRKTDQFIYESTRPDPKELVRLFFSCSEGILLGKLVEELTTKNEFLFQALKITIEQTLKKTEDLVENFKSSSETGLNQSLYSKFLFYGHLGLVNASKFYNKNHSEFDIFWK